MFVQIVKTFPLQFFVLAGGGGGGGFTVICTKGSYYCYLGSLDFQKSCLTLNLNRVVVVVGLVCFVLTETRVNFNFSVSSHARFF